MDSARLLAPTLRPNIFVSYSHADSALVVPVVSLLRASQASVFRDADGIRPGKKWQGELDAAILDANMVVVFWCQHAQSSSEVFKEFSLAIAQGKDVLPLLIDDTPLPPDLTQFQYIDFRGVLERVHVGRAPASPPQRPSRMSRRRTVWLAALGFMAIASTLLALDWIWSPSADPEKTARPDAPTQTPPEAPTQTPPDAPTQTPPDAPTQTPPDAPVPLPPLPPDASDYPSLIGAPGMTLLLLVAVLVGISYTLIRRLRRKARDKAQGHPSKQGSAGELDVDVSVIVARRIEQEIARRSHHSGQ